MAKFRKIGILSSGGDAPGMNAAIRAAARNAMAHGIEVVGILEGYNGLINGNIVPLDSKAVSNVITHGGTMLYSSRCPEFKTPEGMAKAVATCKEHGIDAVIALGGDGTFRGATDLTNQGIPSIGIPCTIDNDITATEYTIGFDTAMNTVLQLVDSRVGPTADDEMMLNFLSQAGLPFVVVATKIDKLNATERKNNLEAIRNHPLVGGAPVIPFSSLKGEGKEELWKTIFRYTNL